MLLEDLAAAGPLDALFLDLHGAMVTEHLPDGEGELLRRLARSRAPICRSWRRSTCTPTSPRRWSTHSDALVAYRTYPHIDLAVTGARCLPLLERLLAGLPLAKAWRRIDFLVPLPWQCTHDRARALALCAAGRDRGGRRAVGLDLHGLPAGRHARSAVPPYWPTPPIRRPPRRRRHGWRGRSTARSRASPAGCGVPPMRSTHAMRSAGDRPVILADTQDNPGGGGSADTTGLLAALIAARADGRAAGAAVRSRTPPRRHTPRARGPSCTGSRSAGSHGPAGVAPIVGDFAVLRLGVRPVHRHRADVWRQPHGSRADGAAARVRGAGRRGRRVVAAAAGGRPGHPASSRRRSGRANGSWR